MKWTILNVAFPFAPVGSDAVGGSEQILSMIDNALVQSKHTSIVLACAGSKTRGIHLSAPAIQGNIDEKKRNSAYKIYRDLLETTLGKKRIDLIHFHGLDFDRYLPNCNIPILATFHLPLDWYSPEVFKIKCPFIHFNCVSWTQWKSFGLKSKRYPPVIENGIPLRHFKIDRKKDNYALWLGRICPEKAPHLALEAAHQGNFRLTLAGKVFPYDEHRRYFERKISPYLDEKRRFIGAVSMEEKSWLLRKARCLIVTSSAPETSSLVAMESISSGTPVIAFPSGALVEIVENGKTGFFAKSIAEVASFWREVNKIDPETCRENAEKRFDETKMTKRYFKLYERIICKYRSRKNRGSKRTISHSKRVA